MIRESFGSYFPPRVVDADGRRVRPGSIVIATDLDASFLCQVQGWSREGLVLLAVEDDVEGNPQLLVRHPSLVRKYDAELIDVVLPDELFIEVDGPSSVVVTCVGTRDVVVKVPNTVGSQVGVLPSYSTFEDSDDSDLELTPSSSLCMPSHGSRSRASEVLSRRRALTLPMIRKIHEEWRLPLEILTRPYRLRTTQAA